MAALPEPQSPKPSQSSKGTLSNDFAEPTQTPPPPLNRYRNVSSWQKVPSAYRYDALRPQLRLRWVKRCQSADEFVTTAKPMAPFYVAGTLPPLFTASLRVQGGQKLGSGIKFGLYGEHGSGC